MPWLSDPPESHTRFPVRPNRGRPALSLVPPDYTVAKTYGRLLQHVSCCPIIYRFQLRRVVFYKTCIAPPKKVELAALITPSCFSVTLAITKEQTQATLRPTRVLLLSLSLSRYTPPWQYRALIQSPTYTSTQALRDRTLAMSVAEMLTQTIFGMFAVLGVLATLAGLHYRGSLCYICVQRLRRPRVQCMSLL
jgi:hypothetical protein